MSEPGRPRPIDIASGEAWSMLVDRLTKVGALVWDPGTPGPAERPAEGLRYLLRFLAAGISVCIEHDDTDAPELGRMIEDRMSWGLDNPDTLYTYTRVRGDADYRIVGRRGTARHVEFQVNTGHYSDGDFTGWRAVSALAGDAVIDSADGGFEIVLSRERHGANVPDAVNWMALDDDASFLLIRQYFADWEHEQPWDLAIERTDGSLPPPPLDDELMAARLGLLLDWLDIGLNCWDSISQGFLGARVGDITPFIPPDEASGLKGQAYGMAPWRCAPDETVVLELRPPACRMWGISLCDRYWQSIDFADRQSSINSSQATLTDGGVFIGVIAHDDPGVANWLDPSDETEGTIAVRYLLPDGVPSVSYRTVPRADLDASLPGGTPFVTAAERQAMLRRRRLAVARAAIAGKGTMERFIVGTGRCGSTLLSLMLAQHRDVVSLHEFFTGLDWGRRFAPGPVSGADLAVLIGAEQPITTAVLGRGHTSDEIQYPFGSEKVRHVVTDPVPWLSITMLSRLTDDPDAWYDELMAFARSRPPASMAQHYLDVFEWATDRSGGSVWVERSGSSIDYLGDLAALYPEARFVHIHRDGHEAALSIRSHPFFRLGVAVLMDLFPESDDPEAAVTQVIESDPPCWAVGRYWSDQVLRGFRAVPELDRAQFLQVRFEDLVHDPRPVLTAVAAFLELDDDAEFLERAAALVRGAPRRRFDDLDADERAELRQACRPGQMLLGRAE